MVLFARLLLSAFALAWIAQPADVKKSALDKPTFEAYVRHLFVWGPQIKIAIGDPKPAPIPGMLEVSVEASAGVCGAVSISASIISSAAASSTRRKGPEPLD